MKSLVATVILSLVMVSHPELLWARGDSTESWLPGVLFSIGTTDGTVIGNGNALSVWLRAGYDLSSSMRLSALFSTGHHHIDPSPARPVFGTMLLGAGTLEVLYRFSGTSPLSPFVAVDGGLSTILDDQLRGYNGWVMHVRGGLEWQYSPSLALDGFVGWGGWTWQNAVGDGVPPFETFHAGTVAVGLSVIFHPVLRRQL